MKKLKYGIYRIESNARRKPLAIEPLEKRLVLNSAPVLDPTASTELMPVAEDAGPPVGAVGAPVSALIDSGGPLNNFSDVDGDPPGIAITGVNLQGGALWHSVNGGVTWSDVGAASELEPKLLAANSLSRIYYQPAMDFSGEVNDVISFRAWDQYGLSTQLGENIYAEAAGDRSGYSVSLSADGSTVAIGAPYNDTAYSNNAGHVRVFRWSGSVWRQLGDDIDGEGHWLAGQSVSLSADGNTVAFTAPLSDGNGENSGLARVYRWSGTAWAQIGSDIHGEAAGDNFDPKMPVSLSADGRTVAIAARRNDGNGTDSGHTRVYRWSDTDWEQLGGDIDGENAGDRSGNSVSLSADGNTVAIGAGVNGSGRGHARIYRWSETDWEQLGDDIDGKTSNGLVDGIYRYGDYLGDTVCLSADGRTVAVSAPLFDVLSSTRLENAGRARVYQWSGSAWEQVGDDIVGAGWGSEATASLALSGDGCTIVTGGPEGRARIFRWSGATWELIGEATAYSETPNVAISSDGSTVAIGVPGFNNSRGVALVNRLLPASESLSVAEGSANVSVVAQNDAPTISLDGVLDWIFDGDKRVAANGYPLRPTANTSWLYGTASSGTFSVDYYPTSLGELGHVDYHGYVSYFAPEGDATLGRFMPPDTTPGKFHLYRTYAVSGKDQTLPFWFRCNDGASIFVDGEFIAGGGFGVVNAGDINFSAGIPREIVLLGHNGVSETHVTFQVGGGVIESAAGMHTSAALWHLLDETPRIVIDEDSPWQNVEISGVTAGGGESQPLRVTARSSNVSLIPDPIVKYAPQDSFGSFAFLSAAGQSGTAVITVMVEDGGLDEDLLTVEDNATAFRTLEVFVNEVNDAPEGITLSTSGMSVLESADTSSRLKVSGILVQDDRVGDNTLSLSGEDASSFEIDGTDLFLKAGVGLNYETKSSYSVTVEAIDTSVAGSAAVSADFTLTVTDVNEPPESVALMDMVASLAENADTSSRTKLANIVVPDDALGVNTLSLSGTDAASFEIVGSELFFRAGAALDYETQASYSVTVEASDPSLPGSTPVTADYVLTVADVNEAPNGVTLTDAVTALSENTDTATRVKVASVSVVDDSLGTNTLSLSGVDADYFEIVGAGLFLKADVPLDYETKPSLSVTVDAIDSSISGGQAVSTEFTLDVTNVGEPPFGSVMTLTSDGRWFLGRSDGTRFNMSVYGIWNSNTVEWTSILQGDVNGDGLVDVIGRTHLGQWWATLNQGDGTGGGNQFLGYWKADMGFSDVVCGDFNGDGRDDVAGRTPSGQWWVGLSKADSLGFTNQRFARWNSSLTWGNVLVGDYNGDGRDDIAGLSETGIWQGILGNADGSGEAVPLGVWSPSLGFGDIRTGDFNGDGRTDIIGRTSNGQWWVAMAQAVVVGFNNELIGGWSTATDWTSVASGDFNGDGQTDIVGRASNGQWWGLMSDGGTQLRTNTLVGYWSRRVNWTGIITGDADGDGRDDIIGRIASGDKSARGRIWVGRIGEGMMQSQAWGFVNVPAETEAKQIFFANF